MFLTVDNQTVIYCTFSRIFQQNESFGKYMTSGCHGNTFVGIMSKSTNLAKIALLVFMETWSCDNSDKFNNPEGGTF